MSTDGRMDERMDELITIVPSTNVGGQLQIHNFFYQSHNLK